MSLISEPPHGTVERLVETLLQLSDGKPGSVVELTVGPGLPVYTLDYEAIVNWDLERAKGKFWRFVVFDSADQPSIADMTLEDAPRFSSRSHGYHAEAYVDHLSRLAEQTFGEEDYQEVRVLDVPTYSTLALWMMGKSGSVFFPVQILGQSVPFSLVDEDEFQRLFGDAVIGYRESVLSGRTIVSPSFDHALKSTNGDEQDSEMADDNSEVPAAEPAAASSVEPKKKRAPRRTRAEIDAAAASKKGRRAVRKAATAQESATASAKAASKRARKSSKSTAADPNSAAGHVGDDLADLLKLEAENQSLRRQVAEKLRAENADLRKKLGLN